MSENENLEIEFNEIKDRIKDILKILDIYDMNDEESIKSLREELDSYKKRLTEMCNE